MNVPGMRRSCEWNLRMAYDLDREKLKKQHPGWYEQILLKELEKTRQATLEQQSTESKTFVFPEPVAGTAIREMAYGSD